VKPEDLKETSKDKWGAAPAGWTFGGGAEIGTRQFFENVLRKRSTWEQPWLFELVPFSSFRGLEVLELGCGAGYDAYEFCRQGADFSGIDITPQNPLRTLTHLGHYGYAPKLAEADAELLPFKDGTFDAVYSNGVLHHTPDMVRAFREARRVLKPRGELWLVVYHRDSIFHWLNVVLVQYLLNRGFRHRTYRHQLSMIEMTPSRSLPLVNVYSRHRLRTLLHRGGFEVRNLWVRKLVWEDLPPLRGSWRISSRIPQPCLDLVGRWFGWYLIAHARKR
jgi:SAM-dependent methyltransferase